MLGFPGALHPLHPSVVVHSLLRLCLFIAALRLLIAAAARGYFLSCGSPATPSSAADDELDDHHDVEPVQDKHVAWLRRKLAQLGSLSAAAQRAAHSSQQWHAQLREPAQDQADVMSGSLSNARVAHPHAPVRVRVAPVRQFTRSDRPIPMTSHPLHGTTVSWDSRIAGSAARFAAPPRCLVLLRPLAATVSSSSASAGSGSLSPRSPARRNAAGATGNTGAPQAHDFRRRQVDTAMPRPTRGSD